MNTATSRRSGGGRHGGSDAGSRLGISSHCPITTEGIKDDDAERCCRDLSTRGGREASAGSCLAPASVLPKEPGSGSLPGCLKLGLSSSLPVPVCFSCPPNAPPSPASAPSFCLSTSPSRTKGQPAHVSLNVKEFEVLSLCACWSRSPHSSALMTSDDPGSWPSSSPALPISLVWLGFVCSVTVLTGLPCFRCLVP